MLTRESSCLSRSEAPELPMKGSRAVMLGLCFNSRLKAGLLSSNVLFEAAWPASYCCALIAESLSQNLCHPKLTCFVTFLTSDQI